MKIAVIGIGGVGGYFGGKLAKGLENSKEHEIYFVARGEHGKQIKEKGLLLQTAEEGDLICTPTQVFETVNQLPQIDVCFLCVKQYDLLSCLESLKDKVTESTILIPLLNGIDIYERIRTVIDMGLVFPACVYVGTHIAKPGIVRQAGGACQIIFGPDKTRTCEKPDLLCKLLEDANIKFQWTTGHLEKIWEKYLFIASYGMVTATEQKTLGEVYQETCLRDKTKHIIEEILSIGKAEGITFPDGMVQTILKKALTFPADTKTSFQRDVEAGKRDERELFIGAMLSLGEKYQLPIEYIREVAKKLY